MRIKNSKILAVYAVFKGDNNQNSIVWGLAEDINNSDKKFHWITDLKGDISQLVN